MYVYILCVSGLLPTKCKAFEDGLLILLFTTENSIPNTQHDTVNKGLLKEVNGKHRFYYILC